MGTQYLKGSTAVKNFPEKLAMFTRNNGEELTLALDTCAECVLFPMSYIDASGEVKVSNFDRDHLNWTNHIQRDYG